MIESWIKRWVHYSLRRPWQVVAVATIIAAVLGFEAKQNFNIRSDLADLLPDTKASVANHRWVYQFAGAPEVVEPILAVREPLADKIVVLEGEHEGRRQDIGSFRMEGSDQLVFKLRAPLFRTDVKSIPISLGFNRDRNKLKLPSLTGTASQSGDTLNVAVEQGQLSNLEAFLSELRGGDTNGDGLFAMDVAQEGLETIAAELEALSSVVFVLHRMDLEYFEDNILLFADTDDLKQLKCCVQWKQKESIRAEFSLGDEGTRDNEEDEEEDEEEDDPFADDSSSDEDPDCADRTLDNASCGLKTAHDSSKTRPLPEYFVSNNGYLAMFVRPSTPSNELAANKRTQAEIRQTILKTLEENQESFGWAFVPESLQLGGGYVARHDAVRRIEADLFRSVGVTFAMLFIILLLYYRRGRALVIVLLPLVYGVLGALGVAFLTIGYLNLITTFIFAVLLGLGIDFGIHIMNRYSEERCDGTDMEEALSRALSSTGLATAMGAVTTAASFGSLMLTAFPGFSQFGLIAGVGVPLCLLNVFALIPPLVFLWESWRPIDWSSLSHSSGTTPKGVATIKRMLTPTTVAIVLIASLVVLVASISKLNQIEFEYDMRNVRSLNPEMDVVKQNKSGTTEGLTLSPAIALADNREAASRIYAELEHRTNVDPDFDSIEQLLALDNLIPSQQADKLKIIREIHTLLRKKRDFVDDEEDRQKVDDLYKRSNQKEITTAAIPESLLRFFRGKPRPILADVSSTDPSSILPGMIRWIGASDTRSLGHFVYVFPGKDMTDVRNCIDFSEQMGSVKIDDKPLMMSASQFVYGDLLTVVQEDGASAVLLAFYAVFLCVLLNFAFIFQAPRRAFLALFGLVPLTLFFLMGFSDFLPGYDKMLVFKMAIGIFIALCYVLNRRVLLHSLIVLVPLVVSFVVLLAALPVLGWRINFFNVVVFPTILGIGVDSGIHVYHRVLEEGVVKMPSIMRFTGSSIALATLTTGVGFGAMIGAAHLGLQSIAKLAILGLTITLISAVVFFPCMLHFFARRGWIPDLPGTTGKTGPVTG